jgi:hypothetical protein
MTAPEPARHQLAAPAFTGMKTRTLVNCHMSTIRTMGTGWRGNWGPYRPLLPGAQAGGGGGYDNSWPGRASARPLLPGAQVGGGGGHVPSAAQPLAGYGGCGGPGPGAYIGI